MAAETSWERRACVERAKRQRRDGSERYGTQWARTEQQGRMEQHGTGHGDWLQRVIVHPRHHIMFVIVLNMSIHSHAFSAKDECSIRTQFLFFYPATELRSIEESCPLRAKEGKLETGPFTIV